MMGAYNYVMSQQKSNNSRNNNDPLNTTTATTTSSQDKEEEGTGKASPTNLASHSPLQRGSSSSSKFPHELYRMLETVSSLELDHIVSWNPDGNSLVIHNKHLFESQVMSIFFQRLKYSSFKRLLHLHGFKSVSQRGQDKGTFYHTSFVRNKQELLDRIQKGEKKKPSSAGNSSAASTTRAASSSLEAGRPPKSKSAARARKTTANTKDNSSSVHSKTSSCNSPRPGSRKASPSSTPTPMMGVMATLGQQESTNAHAAELHAGIETETSSQYDRSYTSSSIIHRQNQDRGEQQREQRNQQRQLDQTSLHQVVYAQPSIAMNPNATSNDGESPVQVSRTNTNSIDTDIFSISLGDNQNSGQMLLSLAQQQQLLQRELQQLQQPPWSLLFSDSQNQVQQRLLEQQLQQQLQNQQEQILFTHELVRQQQQQQQQQTQGQGLHQIMMDFLHNSAGNTGRTSDATADATTRRVQQLVEASNPLWDVPEPRPFAPNASPSVSMSRPTFEGVPSQNMTGVILPSASTSTNIASTSLFNARSNVNTASISGNINNEDSKDNNSTSTSNNNSIIGDEKSLQHELFNAWFSSSGGNGGEGPPGANTS